MDQHMSGEERGREAQAGRQRAKLTRKPSARGPGGRAPPNNGRKRTTVAHSKEEGFYNFIYFYI